MNPARWLSSTIHMLSCHSVFIGNRTGYINWWIPVQHENARSLIQTAEGKAPLKTLTYKTFPFLAWFLSPHGILYLCQMPRSRRIFFFNQYKIYHQLLYCEIPVLNVNIREFNLYMESPKLHYQYLGAYYRVWLKLARKVKYKQDSTLDTQSRLREWS